LAPAGAGRSLAVDEGAAMGGAEQDRTGAALRQANRALRLVSRGGDPLDRIHARRAGAASIPKPCLRHELLSVLKTAIGSRRAQKPLLDWS
jgi:hypothetical protein